MHFQLTDIENDYYLAKFESTVDYNNIISKGPWVIYDHYLTVQPWSTLFSIADIFPQNVVAWIQIPGLFDAFYKRSLLQEIRSLVGKVVKIDVQTDIGAHGQFARFAVQVNLTNPLVSKIRVAGKIHRVEYEYLPSICFYCGRFEHAKETCLYSHIEQKMDGDTFINQGKQTTESSKGVTKVQDRVKKEDYGDWMVVEHRHR